MKNYYIIWAIGRDRPGIVAEVSKSLFEKNCNLEDSSMMKLGGEFGVLLIISSPTTLSPNTKNSISKELKKKLNLEVGFKPISKSEAKFQPITKPSYIISVHGPDHSGIVYSVTQTLKKIKFNISNLTTHRTNHSSKAGYILLIEGELFNKKSEKLLKASMSRLQKIQKLKISINPISPIRI